MYYMLKASVPDSYEQPILIRGESIADLIKRSRCLLEEWNPEYMRLSTAEVLALGTVFNQEYQIYEVNDAFNYDDGDYQTASGFEASKVRNVRDLAIDLLLSELEET
ncbi:hypothetical protein IB292_02105 [Vibrio parahaemolyticus]|uniref:Uncharacterized protein n=1 Tax=Vibrio parahaemolyticus TaxID=670 RepID=A0A9Q3UC64_VIBPH|nr:hypothetical protein [Vibrio parahaemolyticus]MCC3803821.1 hypothetical protein [Vibrio parahaemolyticus]